MLQEQVVFCKAPACEGRKFRPTDKKFLFGLTSQNLTSGVGSAEFQSLPDIFYVGQHCAWVLPFLSFLFVFWPRPPEGNLWWRLQCGTNGSVVLRKTPQLVNCTHHAAAKLQRPGPLKGEIALLSPTQT